MLYLQQSTVDFAIFICVYVLTLGMCVLYAHTRVCLCRLDADVGCLVSVDVYFSSETLHLSLNLRHIDSARLPGHM